MSGEVSQVGAVGAVFNTAIPTVGSVVAASPNELLTQGGRRRAEKSWTLDGVGAQIDDVFVITGVVLIHQLMMVVTEATDSTTLTGVQFEIFDQVAPQVLDAGVAGSTCVAGTVFFKGDVTANPLMRIDPTAAFFGEGAQGQLLCQEFVAVKQNAAVTEVRLNFTGDANTDVDVTVVAIYTPISADGALTAAP
jgi:hypothetical protein